MFDAEDAKPAASAMLAGSLNIWNPIAESASCRSVERSAVNAVGAPPTSPRQVTSPYLVRYVTRRYDPAGVGSAVFGVHALSCASASIAVQLPWKRYPFEFTVGVPPPGSHSATAYVSVMSC